jgi:two-component system sensor histidine kinase AgrC
VIPISAWLGNFINKRIVTLDESLKHTFSKYLLYGAMIAFVGFASFFLREVITEVMGYPLVYTIFMAVSFVLLIIAIFLFEESIRKEIDLRHKDESLNNLREHAKNLEGLSKEARQFRHDHENLMLGFHKHLKKQDTQGALEYYEKYMDSFYESVAAINRGLDILDKIKSPELQGILSHKIPSAQRAGINVTVDVSDDMKPIPAEQLIDVCRIIGILIDNAIEACINTAEPTLRLGVFNKSPATLIVVENNFATPPDLAKLAEEGYTTKENGQGIGLYTVAQTIENNPNLGLSTQIKGEYFVQLLSILP